MQIATFNLFTVLFLILFVLRRGFESALDVLQYLHLHRRRDKVPKHLEGKVDLPTIQKAVSYNKDKLRFGIVSDVFGMAAIWIMMLVGFSIADNAVQATGWSPLISGLAFFGILSVLSGLLSLPFELYSIFVIEQKHGFNRQTVPHFFLDKLKGLIIGAGLGGLLLCLVLLLMEKGGPYWWLIAFVGTAAVQLLMVWIYPFVIMPMFNKFTKVEGDLADDVARLASSVRFPLKSVFSMDGSKRSAHANAFIIGLVGARKIVLFDTLIEKVTRSQLIAVLAHELGHFKLNHLPRRIVLLILSLGFMFFGISILKDINGIFAGFGFDRSTDAAAIVIFSLIIQEVAAPFGFILRFLSRRDEYAADRFAVEATKTGRDLSDALIALTKQNLSSPGSHPWYRAYHNSHPALKHRLAAMKAHAEACGFDQTE
jgi:STE24 endopeptidase